MAKKTTYVLLSVVLVALVSTAFVGGFAYGHLTARNTSLPIIGTPKALRVLEDARNMIKQRFVGKVNDAALNDGALEGMVKSLKDKHSEYISPKQMSQFRAHTFGEFSGVGVTLGMRKSRVTVIRPLPNTPAQRAGIKAGDTILAIDGQSTAKMSLAAASDKIRGPKGTSVKLQIQRTGAAKAMVFSVKRATISLPTVRSSVVSPGLGYIDIRGFTPNTGVDFEKAVTTLARKRVKGVVVDVRENPGGLVEAAVEVASVFIPRGTIVSLKGRDGQSQTLSAIDDEYHTGMKLVVLVNGNSASASEILAGAVQDHKRGLIVGTKTFGKASVQTVEDLENGGALKITTAHYYTPKDRLIQNVGIKPDMIDKSPADPMHFGTKKDVQRTRAIEILKKLVAGKIKV